MARGAHLGIPRPPHGGVVQAAHPAIGCEIVKAAAPICSQSIGYRCTRSLPQLLSERKGLSSNEVKTQKSGSPITHGLHVIVTIQVIERVLCTTAVLSTVLDSKQCRLLHIKCKCADLGYSSNECTKLGQAVSTFMMTMSTSESNTFQPSCRNSRMILNLRAEMA